MRLPCFFSEYTYDFNGNILSLQRNDANAHTMHNIAYTYSPTRNRLLRIQGTGLSSSRYGYDPVGNLTMDHGRGLTVFWNSAGRVTGVDLPEGKTGISYSPAGLRQMKEVVLNGIEHKTTFYLHDASGHVMATYGLENDTLRVEDLYIYGSSRLGAYRLDGVLTFSPNDSVFSRPVGKRRYELTDHLGNVTVTLSDRKSVAAYSANYISYRAVSLSYTDYYPFGFPIPERSSQGNGYRYGFNGQEKDDEIYGEERAYGFDARMYDSRLGRWWSIDPKRATQPGWSPYKAFLDNPVLYIDDEGSTEIVTIITTNKETGNTTIEVKSSSWVMTDGVRREIPSGGGYYQATNYYDYHTVILRTVGADGAVLDEQSKSQIVYSAKRFSKGFFFDPDDPGRRLPWVNKGGGLHLLSDIGGFQETRQGLGNIQNLDIDLLLTVIGASLGASKAKAVRPGDVADALEFLSGMLELGTDVTGAVQESVEAAKSGNYKLPSEENKSNVLDPEEKIIVTVPYKNRHGRRGTVSQSDVSRKDSAKTAKEIKEIYSR